MELYWQNQAKNLVARIDCRNGPARLQGGGYGWFRVAFIDWRLDWKLRVQVSVTKLQAGYGWPSRQFVRFAVRDDVIEVAFPISDCIYPFRNGGWGCSEGELVTLSHDTFHCQTMLQAKPPSFRSTLRRSVENNAMGIDLLEGANLVQRLNDQQRMTSQQVEVLLAEEGLTGIRVGFFGNLILEQMSVEKARKYLRKWKHLRDADATASGKDTPE